MYRLALLAGAISVAGIGGCSPADKRTAATAQATEKSALVCAGSQLTSDLTAKGPGTEAKMTKHFILEKDDLLEWDKNRGAPISVCEGWGAGCYVRMFPLEIEMKAARSAQEKIDISIFREKGVIIYERKEFDNLVLFSGKYRKGSLPSVSGVKIVV